MAVMARGKGKRRREVELVRQGAVLRRRETEAGEEHLTGWRRFPDEERAAAALADEVAALLLEKLEPQDEEARALLAASASAEDAAPPALPLRRDLAVTNEATGFVVTSRKQAGKAREEGSPEWLAAAAKGELFPVGLVQDDPFVLRVVAGEPLSAQEDEEWLARLDWHLNLPDGRLCVTGGAVFFQEDYDPDDADLERYVAELALPKGRYRATLYTYLHGVNGDAVLDHLAGGHDRGEPRPAWHARTRPGEELPDWEEREWVDFLLHLEPVARAPKAGLSELPADGWFPWTAGARLPRRCPLGLAARDVVRPREVEQGGWTFVRDVAGLLGGAEPAAVTGGVPSLPLTALGRAARVAWFASRVIACELRLKPPAGAPLDLSGAWPEGVVAAEEGGLVRIMLSADLNGGDAVARLGELGPRLAALPKGTLLELLCAPLDLLPGAPEAAGKLWLRGPAGEGQWRIARAWPAASAEALTAALTLAGEVEGTKIALREAAEGEAILAWARRCFGPALERNRPRAGADAIRLPRAGDEVALVGAAAFAHRHAATWPVTDLAAEPELDPDDDGMFPTKPIQGALILTAPSGRSWHQTMALLVSQRIGEAIPPEERRLFGAGFKHAGDLMTPADEAAAWRGYARPGGDAWAWFRVQFPARVELRLVTTFPGGATLTTGREAGAADDPAAGRYAQGFPGAAPQELVEHHARRVAELSATLGAPAPVEAGLKGFAAALEEAALRGATGSG